MAREEALELAQSKVSNKNLIKHMLATEACMRNMARRFDEDEDPWGMAGLLHDLDYDETKDNFCQHGLISAAILEDRGLGCAIVEAIKAHPGHAVRESNMAKALYFSSSCRGCHAL